MRFMVFDGELKSENNLTGIINKKCNPSGKCAVF
jgi:hypothetical protein